ncbi:MAG: HAD-IC family P-type ATPase [Acidimicrobiales bacterium]|nr:HAD-IC family P-type ATPase [Acidimicrobiales bacterium]
MSLDGLSPEEVSTRVKNGQTNKAPETTSRSLSEIISANVFNPVNAIMLALFVLILIAGFPADGLFVGVVIGNSVIGVTQEIYARRELMKLQLLNAPSVRVLRERKEIEIEATDIVVDDLLVLGAGDQVVVDGDVKDSTGLEIDESLLTGESDPVVKEVGDQLLSGSFVNAGSGVYQAKLVGADSYANTLAIEAKRFALVDSELRKGINTILRVLMILIPPACALLLFALLDVEDQWQNALQGSIAAAVAMVPDGLVLLTSLSFVAGVVTIAKRKALAKELATVELLARVDTLCLDKTGTITTGEISFGNLEVFEGVPREFALEALGAIAHSDPDPNPTMAAIALTHGAPSGWKVVTIEPFKSARKWSAAEFEDHGTYFIGAPDILIDASFVGESKQAQEHAETGRRVLALCHHDGPFGTELPDMTSPLALILLDDTVREDAPEILKFFADQGVDLKVISGDNTATVSTVAARAGVPNAHKSVDARTLANDAELSAAIKESAVFGRVTPHQKRAMVASLQSEGHVVAMTGDGVNDVLALKDADMGIAMGSGSSASRGVAQLVLLDNSFSTLPEVLAQGRKVINNIERVANLFVTKAVYALLLTAIIGIQGVEFPFLPRQLTLIGSFSIGLPGLILALAPNTNLVRPGFLKRVIRFSLPAGAIAAFSAWIVYCKSRNWAGPVIETHELAEARTASTITLLLVGLIVLVVVSRPLRIWKIGLAVAMAGLQACIIALPASRKYFELEWVDGRTWGYIAIVVAIAGICVAILPRLIPGILSSQEKIELQR